MATPLVETKLYAPQARPSAVPRPRLRGLMLQGSQVTVTLISAPAGFGKTTLLTDWLHAASSQDRSAAWLSLDSRDSQPGSFWMYVVAALHRAAPSVGSSALALMESAPPPIETILTTVINELSELPTELDLILDDYHLADSPEIATGMTFLLEHLPSHVHLVLSTRADPALPLARLRSRGELVEVRAADLRFSLDETVAYLNEAIGLDLSPADVETLEERTEGWIAALQLAALSLQGHEDVAGFIAGFAGDDRYVVDYLVEEVLARQPGDVRDFLLETSILDRLSGPLCDAVTGRADGKTMLEGLDRANLFVVRLDDSRRWYRYHHLFADVLRTYLADERPDDVAGLHSRASEWYDAAGDPRMAVSHALEAGDVDRAAGLVEVAVPAMSRDRQEATISGWLDVLPDEVVRVRPVLAIGLVGGLMSRGDFEGVEARLQDVERQLAGIDAGTAPKMVVADPRELERLPAAIEMYYAALALIGGDPTATIAHADQALDRAVDDDHLVRAAASALGGLARWSMGDLESAHAAYSIAVDGLERAGHIADVLGCSITLADLRVTQGRLSDAQRTFERALRLADGEPVAVRGTPDMHVGLSQIAWERGDSAAAAEHLRCAAELGAAAGLPQNAYRSRVAMSRVAAAGADPVGALDLLGEAEQVYNTDFSPDVRPVSAIRARLLVAHGRLDEARSWAREQTLSADDELSYVREYAHVTLARLLLAEHDLVGTASLLQRLLDAAEAGGRTGTAIEILVLLSLVEQESGDSPTALASLQKAMALAEPEEYLRVFVDEGPAMTTLLRALSKGGDVAAYARRLLAFDVGVDAAGTAPSAVPGVAGQGLVDPLSDRELDVLRLLASDLDGPEIARSLSVSVNTLRTHTKHIYTKLGVNNRRGAVSRARQLHLL